MAALASEPGALLIGSAALLIGSAAMVETRWLSG